MGVLGAERAANAGETGWRIKKTALQEKIIYWQEIIET
jgi:hypothetical protein